ncbi:hypothetical protein ACFO0S_14625 [Chryseomicrobium palamuruense]|uniref:Uncharacterized protein n=1 Tax=Chryseomicrobium palamuruense TaxID=682973 RepID=A0ABV8V0W9_9BACL
MRRKWFVLVILLFFLGGSSVSKNMTGYFIQETQVLPGWEFSYSLEMVGRDQAELQLRFVNTAPVKLVKRLDLQVEAEPRLSMFIRSTMHSVRFEELSTYKSSKELVRLFPVGSKEEIHYILEQTRLILTWLSTDGEQQLTFPIRQQKMEETK